MKWDQKVPPCHNLHPLDFWDKLQTKLHYHKKYQFQQRRWAWNLNLWKSLEYRHQSPSRSSQCLLNNNSSSSPTSLKLLLNNVPELPGKRHFSSSLLKAMLLCGMNQHGQLLTQNDHLQRMRKWTLSWTWTSFPRLLFLLAGPSKMDSYNSEKFKMSGDFEGTTS